IHRRCLTRNIILGLPRFKKDDPSHGVELMDPKPPYFGFPPAIAPSRLKHRTEPRSQLRSLLLGGSVSDSDVLSILHESLPDIPLFQHSEVGGADNLWWSLFCPVIESSFEQRQLSVDSSILGWSPTASGLRFSVVDVLFDQVRGNLSGE